MILFSLMMFGLVTSSGIFKDNRMHIKGKGDGIFPHTFLFQKYSSRQFSVSVTL